MFKGLFVTSFNQCYSCFKMETGRHGVSGPPVQRHVVLEIEIVLDPVWKSQGLEFKSVPISARWRMSKKIVILAPAHLQVNTYLLYIWTTLKNNRKV